eukprot:UN04188
MLLLYIYINLLHNYNYIPLFIDLNKTQPNPNYLQRCAMWGGGGGGKRAFIIFPFNKMLNEKMLLLLLFVSIYININVKQGDDYIYHNVYI